MLNKRGKYLFCGKLAGSSAQYLSPRKPTLFSFEFPYFNRRNKSFKFIFLFFILVLLVSFVFAADSADDEKKGEVPAITTTDPNLDISDLLKQFDENMGDSVLSKELAKKLNGMTTAQKNDFFSEVAKKTGVDALKSLGSKVKTFDVNGNVVLEGGGKIDLLSMYDYSVDVQSGDKRNYGYKFRDGDYRVDAPKIKDVKVDLDKVIYEFENGANLEVREEGTFDFKSRKIMIGEKGVEWLNMNGGVKVDGSKIDLGIIYDEKGENTLKDFPILKDESGYVVSPFHEGVSGVELPGDFKKPSKGKYKIYTKDGKKYSVDYKGAVRELKSSSISLDKDGNLESSSDSMVDVGEPGEFFTQKDTAIYGGESAPEDRSKSFIWIGGKKGDKNSVVVNSVGSSKMYYNLKSNLASLEINGNTVVKNGNVFLESDSEGNINVRKIDGTDGNPQFIVEKIFTDKKKEVFFKLDKYTGEKTELKGKIVIFNKDGQIYGGPVDMKTIKMGDPSSYSIQHIQQLGGGGDPSTQLHEGTHVLNGKLTDQYFKEHPETAEKSPDGWTGPGYKAIYLGNGEYTVVKHTPFKTGQIAEYVPSDLRDGRYSTYVSGSQSSHELVENIFDEYSAYDAATKYMIEHGSGDTSLNDYLRSNSEMGIYSVAGAMKIAKDSPDYWNGENGQQYKALMTTMWERSFQNAAAVEQKYGAQKTSDFRGQINTLKTSANDGAMREFIKKEMPSVASKIGI